MRGGSFAWIAVTAAACAACTGSAQSAARAPAHAPAVVELSPPPTATTASNAGAAGTAESDPRELLDALDASDADDEFAAGDPEAGAAPRPFGGPGALGSADPDLENLKLSLLANLTSRGASSESTWNVLSASNAPTTGPSLAAAAGNSAIGASSGSVAGGVAVGGGTGLSAPGGASPPVAPVQRTGSAIVGGTSATGGTVANAASVVARLRGGFRRCYVQALAANPAMSGSMRIQADLDAHGTVVAARVTSQTGLSVEVVQCCLQRVSAATFAPPDGADHASLAIPIAFVH